MGETMLFPSKMVEVEVLLHDSVKYRVLKAMQRKGFIHITSHNIEEIGSGSPSKDISQIVEFEFRIEKLLGILNLAKQKNEGLRSLFNPEPPERYPAKDREREEIMKDAKDVLDEVENKILGLYTKWENINEAIEDINTQKNYAKYLLNMPCDIGYLGEGPYVYITAGIVRDMETLLNLEKDKKIALWHTAMGKKKNRSYLVVAACYIEDKKELEAALRFSNFTEFELEGWKGKPDKVIKDMEKRVEELKKEKEDVLKKIEEYRDKYYGRLAVLKDDLTNERIKEEVHPKFGKTIFTTIIRGFIPKKELDNAINVIKSAGDDLVHIEWKDAEGDDVPVKYNNPRIFRPFQAFVDMYSTPKYGHIDPTIIIAPLFIAFFGLTLGDAGYGFIIALLGYLLWRHIGKYNWTNRTLGEILFASGISAIAFGIVQGGIFGPLDSNNMLSQFIHYQPLINPMQDAVRVLVIALIIGISQISLGLVLGAYHHLKFKNYGEFLTSEVSWFLILPSSGVVIGKSFGWWTFAPMTVTISWVILTIGIVFLSGIPAKMIDKKSAVNAMAFFDITGMVGDWLSYSRLLALDLATSGIALTINLFAGIISTMVVGAGSMVCCMPIAIVGIALFGLVARKKDKKKTGIALFFLILGIIGVINLQAALWLFLAVYLIIAHIGNALLQSLGSLVHSLRLQYVEFFSRFYEGDGVKFEPFREVRKNSRLVEAGGVKK